MNKILVTGANGFIGKHLCLHLEREGFVVFKYDLDSTESQLIDYINECDFLVHLAGINRPLSVEEFYDGNANFTAKIINLIKESGRVIPIIMSSSIQASLDNDYGKSKKMGEDFLLGTALIKNQDNYEDGAFYMGTYLISTENNSFNGVIKEGTVCIADKALQNNNGLTKVLILLHVIGIEWMYYHYL